MHLFSLLLLSCLFTSCAIQDLGYFYVDPFAKPFPSKAGEPIYLILEPTVEDEIFVQGPRILPMEVTHFRKSLVSAFENTLKKNFDEVIVQSERPEEGLSLVIYRVKPYWKLATTADAGWDGTINDPIYTTAFQYESSLIRDDSILESADGKYYSDIQFHLNRAAHHAFKAGTTELCEQIHQKLFTDEVQRMLTNSEAELNSYWEPSNSQ